MVHRNTPPTALPRLPAPPAHELLKGAAPLDLRSARYAKLPGSSSSFGSFTTDDDEPHPLPCYSADEETFAPVKEMPWVTEKKKKIKKRNEEWDRNPRNADAAVENLINETLDEETAVLAQWVLDDLQNEADADQELEGIANEEFLGPVTETEASLVVWTLLYDLARETTQQELAKMKETHKSLAMDEKSRNALANHVLEVSFSVKAHLEMPEEESLMKTPWHVLVYNYSLKLQNDSLTFNVALNMLQWVLDDLQNEADADQELEGIANEEFLGPVTETEASLVVWTLLYDLARETTQQELAKMKETHKSLAMDEKSRNALANHVLEGQDWFEEMPEEESLMKTPWHVLVYNYSLKLQNDSLTFNVALNMLQETVATGAALAELVSTGLLMAAEDDLAALDKLERSVNPPRRG
ncbi:hypothetical protein FHG87_012584 [Trinorchestia longiramus]|nr:hypothetical protein FHG87_012584 [Trinorchestia longiramus]